jgi:GDP-mannose transporter
MDEKKNEDFAIKMPEHEMRSFSASPTHSAREPFLSKPNGRSNGAPSPLANITNSPPISILAYCLASISMTVTNKYCVSGPDWNLNFFYLAIQVCS